MGSPGERQEFEQNLEQEAVARASVSDSPLDDLVGEIDDITDPDGGVVQEPQPQPQPQPQDPQPQDPQEQQALEPPAHWSEEKKEVFRRLTPEAQRFLLDRHREMEGDYTRKTQLLAEQARAVAGLQGLAVHLQRDPNFRQHLQQYFQGQAQTQAAPAQPQAGQPGPAEEELSPVEILKREAADEALKRMMAIQQAQQVQQSEVALNQKRQAILRMKQEDPLAATVQQKLDEYVASQPLDWQKQATYQALATNPDVYHEMYMHFRRQVEAEGQQQEHQQESGGDPRPQTQGQPRGGYRAPRLERGGGDRRPTTAEAKRRKIMQSKNQALASGDTDALASFLDEAGVIDQLL